MAKKSKNNGGTTTPPPTSTRQLLSPEHIHNLARLLAEDRLVLFVGAGISHQATARNSSSKRLPLWRELAKLVGDDFTVSAAAMDGNLLDLFDYIDVTRGRISSKRR